MLNQDNIADIRRVYQLKSLSEEDVAEDPMVQFETWWQEAVQAGIDEVNAMTLATVDEEGMPSARTVLLKGIHENGFVFFTNYNSRKVQEIIANDQVALLFFWKELERQVRIEGIAHKTSEEESDAYFASRPRESQLGAWSSPQSEEIASREVLEQHQQELINQYADKAIPRPPHWGGFLVIPRLVEFWQGRPGRLHDRLQYVFTGSQWNVRRLAP